MLRSTLLALSSVLLAVTATGCKATKSPQTTSEVRAASDTISFDVPDAEDICFAGVEGSAAENFSLTALSCKSAGDLKKVFKHVSAWNLAASAVCGAATVTLPNPYTAVVALAFTAGAGVFATAEYLVEVSPCDGPAELDPATRRAVVKVHCELANKTYVDKLGPNGEPGCK